MKFIKGAEIMKYFCPFCLKAPNRDILYIENDLFLHLKNEHPDQKSEPKANQAICPICSADPDGDPNFVSKNLVGHIYVRHIKQKQKM